MVYNWRKLKGEKLPHATCTRESISHIKKTENSTPIKVLNMNTLHDLFPNFNFKVHHVTNEEDDFHDTSQDAGTSAFSNYWANFMTLLFYCDKFAFFQFK